MKSYFDRFFCDFVKFFFIFLGSSLISSVALSGTLAQSPLFLATGAKPNIMLMIDNSGSMSNIVGDAPYDKGTTYLPSCTGTNLIPTCSSSSCVEIRIESNKPKIWYNGASYDFGNSGSGKRCFNSTATYTARLNADNGTGPSGYLDTEYSGNYLNWYFNSSNTSPTWTNQTKKPGTKSRLEVAKESSKVLVTSLSNVRLGLTTYNGDDGGSLREIVGDINTLKIANINTKIDALTASSQTPLAETLSDIGKYFAFGETGNLTLHPELSTTAARSVDAIFQQGGTNHSIKNDSGQTIVAPVIHACQKNFALLLTDGRPQADRNISDSLRDYTGDCGNLGLCDATSTTDGMPSTAITATGSTTTCSETEKNWRACKNGSKEGRVYESGGSDYLDDVAQALYEMDLRPGLDDATIKSNKNNLATYAIGFADTKVTNNLLLNDTAIRGGGKFTNAANSTELIEVLQNTVTDISSVDQSAAAVAANSSRLDTTTLIYQSQLDPSDWTGELIALTVNTTNGDTTQAWLANEEMPAFNNRNIFTFNPNGVTGLKGAPFQWADLTCPGPASSDCLAANVVGGGLSQQDLLNKDSFSITTDTNGALRVNWLRGDHSNEKISNTDTTSGHLFRSRLHTDKTTGVSSYRVLGDIVNSDPIFVGNQDYGYGAFADLGGSYTTFISSAAYKNRTPMIYVGANDGMLHGFDARKKDATSTPPVAGGREIFAYIPNAIFPNLTNLTSPNYKDHHQYYVDGPAGAGDVYDTVSLSWRTVLVGSLGAGGKAYFGLDVTNPTAFGSSSPLWEFTNANDADLGYTFGQASVVRLQDNSWVAIVANGYDSDNGSAVLYVLNAMTGAVLQKIDTGAKPTTQVPARVVSDKIYKNGLSTPIAVDTNNDFKVDTVYAGDLYGNLWKFDLSGIAGSWPVPTSPLFVACTNDGASCSKDNRQPITTKPNVGDPGAAGTDQNGIGKMVYFGTGKYFEAGDNIVPATPSLETFYGLWDVNGAVIANRANLQSQTITFDDFGSVTCSVTNTSTTPNTTTTSSCQSKQKLRLVSNNTVCYAATSAGCTTSSALVKGWKIDLKNPDNSLIGERAVSFPLVRRGLVVFATLIPDSSPCKTGGDSRLMEVDALKGSAFTDAAFDTNSDGVVDDKDKVTVTLTGGTTTNVSAAGVDLGIGIIKTPAVVEGAPSSTTRPTGTIAKAGVDYKYSSGTASAKVGKVVDKGESSASLSTGGTRKAWVQLK